MRCAQWRASAIATNAMLVLCFCLPAGLAAAQSVDQYPRDSRGYYIAPDLSDMPFSLPEGTDSPEYREPLFGNSRRQGPIIKSFYREGFASDAVISSYVGNTRIAMENCDTSHSTLDHRVVRVDLERDNYAFRRVVDGILLRAAEFAWHHCPRTYWLANVWNNLDYLYNIHEVDVYLPNGNLAIRARLQTWYGGDGSLWSGSDYSWGSVEDVEGKRRQEAAQLAQAQAEQERQRAAQAQAEQERIAAQQRYEEEARESEARWRILRPLLWLVFIGGILYWKRNTLARWYYLLSPHPAHALVEHAIASGQPLDERSFAESMADMPSNPVERQVRLEQAERLATRAREHAQRLAAEAERLRQQARSETQFIHAQEELAEAAIAHELAKTRVDAYRKGVSKHEQ